MVNKVNKKNQINIQKKEPQKGSLLNRAIIWLRADNAVGVIHHSRRAFAVILAGFLTLSIAGIVPLVFAIRKWKALDSTATKPFIPSRFVHQLQSNQRKLPPPKPLPPLKAPEPKPLDVTTPPTPPLPQRQAPEPNSPGTIPPSFIPTNPIKPVVSVTVTVDLPVTNPEPVVIPKEPEPVVITPEPEPEPQEVLTPEPEPIVVAKDPEPTEPEPVVITPEPEPEPQEILTPKPEPIVIAKDPEPTEPEPVVITPEPEPEPEPQEVLTPEPEPIVVAKEPEPAEPEPVVITPEPEPEPVPQEVLTPEPEPVVIAKEPEPAEPEPVVIAPEPEPEPEPQEVLTPEPEPIVVAKDPEPTEPEPVVIAPEPEPEPQEDLTPEPEPVVTAKEPEPAEPEPVVITPEPEPVFVTKEPEPAPEPIHDPKLSDSFNSSVLGVPEKPNVVQSVLQNVSDLELEELKDKLVHVNAKYNPLTLDALRVNGHLPKFKMILGNVTFYVSSPFFKLSNFYVIGLIKFEDKVYPRIFYLSNSQGNWRVVPYARKDNIQYQRQMGWLGKGLAENDTQVPFELSLELLKLPREAGPSTPYNIHQLVSSVMPGQNLRDSYVATLNMQDFIEAPNEPNTNVPEPYNIKLPADKLVHPDFAKKTEMQVTLEHYGEVTAALVPSHNGDYQYLFYETKSGYAYLAGVELLKDNPLNQYGLRKLSPTLAHMDAPLLEYNIQRRDVDATDYPVPGISSIKYVNNWNYVREIPIIQEYYLAKGVTIPERFNRKKS